MNFANLFLSLSRERRGNMRRTDESLDFRILLIDENLHMQYVVT